MKFDNYEIFTIKNALAIRKNELDNLLLNAKEDTFKKFLTKEKNDVLILIKKLEMK